MRAKLALTFGMMAALVVLVSVIALSALGDANDSFASYVDGARARAALTEKIRAAVLQRAVAVRNLVLVTKPADVEAERVAMTQAHDEVQARLRQLNEAIATNPDVTAKARVLVAEINRIESRYGPVAVAIGDAALHGQRDQAIAMIDDQCRPLLKELVAAA
ncbi:MCP four helix bundle domain-containing protein, partial [Burkholderia contaminans]|uniref:MCP four helix bundle domain-containing protein n=1 Tax=Burkholderia contaminans TaxID=488447 RepID=UPI003AFFDED4